MATAAKEAAPEKAPRRAGRKTKTPAQPRNARGAKTTSQEPDAVPIAIEEPPAEPLPGSSRGGGSYVRRLDLMGRCNGATPLTRAPVDLTAVLSDPSALKAMTDDLFQPFRQSGVAMVVAVLDESSSSAHGSTAAIAGALAGRHDTALGQVTVHWDRPLPHADATATLPISPRPRAKKRGRAASKATNVVRVVEAVSSLAKTPRLDCQRVASFQHEATGLSVEYRRELLPTSAAGTRVLLVSDWIDSLDALMAARDALRSAGADVVGVCFVVATSSTLEDELAKQQVLYSCAWTPTSGAKLTVKGPSEAGTATCQRETSGNSYPSSSLSKKLKVEARPELQYHTSQYEANSPSEDRSINATKPSDLGVHLYAVLDGHGGSVAVDHLQKSLCNEIFSRVSSDSSPEQIENALTQSFLACDGMLKSSLESLPLETRLSKGYCNAGSCAVVALIVRSMLYIANVGDCGAVIGRRDLLSDRVWARELSTEHNCHNASEVKLVMERSRDRNAIRLSKDDQGGDNEYGVRRVAGSLAVTRAFGDFYLKCEELSSAPFKSKVPYITVEPSISKFDLSENECSDQILILASDGLWEVVGSEEAVKIVTQFDTHHSVLFPSSSAALVHVALEKVAHRDGMMLHELMALPRGRERRRFHDDVTCTVIRIKRSRPRISSVETLEESDPTRMADEEPSQSQT